MASVVFNYANWIARYPEFTTLANGANPTVVVPMCFDEATIYCNNTDRSPVCSIPERTALLNMLTAHIVALNFGVNGQAPNQLVGRISTAGEGSVNVGTEMKTPGNAAWYMQTKYGAAYWQATTNYRMMHYVPSPYRPIVTLPGGEFND